MAKAIYNPALASVDDISATSATFLIEPLHPGYGNTLGNSLRRVLLSSVRGGAIVAFRVEGATALIISDIGKLLISAFGLSERLDIPRKEAAAIIDGYFESFPDVKRYMEQAIEEARRNGFVQTLFGRKLYLPDINSQNAGVRGFAERIAINAPIQGTAADIIKIAMIKVDEAIRHHNYRSQMTLQVHDELVFNVPTEEVDEFRQSVKHAMETAASLRVPLIVDVGIGHNWLEAH